MKHKIIPYSKLKRFVERKRPQGRRSWLRSEFFRFINDIHNREELDPLRAENERLREQLASMNEVNTMLAKYGHDATHHLALILEADRNMDDMSQLLINAARFIVDASEGEEQ